MSKTGGLLSVRIQHATCQRCGIKKPVNELHGYDPFSVDAKKYKRAYCRNRNICLGLTHQKKGLYRKNKLERKLRAKKAQELKLRGFEVFEIAQTLNVSSRTIFSYLKASAELS